MKTSSEQERDANTCVELDENAVCDRCGRFGAYQLGDRMLCEDCYMGCGSCCLEFGKDDLWEFDDKS